MIIGVNGSNIGSVGGINHVVLLIRHYADVYYANKIKKIIVWASPKLYISLKKFKSSKIVIINLKKNNFLFHFRWKLFLLNYNLKRYNCDILFALDGIVLRPYKRTVVFYQNLIPFDYQAMLSFGMSIRSIKNILVSYLYFFSSKLCNNFVLLNNYGKNLIEKKIGKLKNICIVPHGVSKNFFNTHEYKLKKKVINIIYVSPIDFYKHQWNVIQAINELNKDKIFDFKLHLVGAVSDPRAFKLMTECMNKANSRGKKIFYYGNKDENYIRKIIKKSDIYLFASSCESFGLTLVEGMASGCFLLVSNKSGMRETTNNLATYFDPYDVDSIKNSIRKFVNLGDLNIKKKIYNLQQVAKQFNWADSFKKLYFFFDKVSRPTKDRKSKVTYSYNFIKKKYLNNLFIFSYSLNYFFPMFLFYLLFFSDQKKISIEYSIILSGITFLIQFLSFNLRNLIITDEKNYIFIAWFGIAFRFITSIIIILISTYIFQGYYFQYTFLNIALAVSLSFWIKELIIAFFERKNLKTIEIIFQLFFIIFTTVFCFLFIHYNDFFFLKIMSLYLVIDILLRISIVLIYFKKNSLIFLKDLGQIFKIEFISSALASSIFLTLLNFVIRVLIDLNFETDAAAYFILLFSIAVLPGSLVSGVIGATYLKKEQSYPFYFSLLMCTYLLLFCLGIIFELLKIDYILNFNTSVVFLTGLLSALGQSIRQLNIINPHRTISAFKNDIVFSLSAVFLLLFFVNFLKDYFIFFIFITTLTIIYLNLKISPIKKNV